jgi:hypothetical protein
MQGNSRWSDAYVQTGIYNAITAAMQGTATGKQLRTDIAVES